MSSFTPQTRNVAVRAARRHVGVWLAAIFGVGAIAVVALLVTSLALPDLFGSTTREEPNAVVLAQIDDLAEFQAATGRFQTIVDLEEDANLLPDWLKGEHTVLAAEGDVVAAVDLSGISEDAVEVSADGKHATVHVPAPTLQETHLDTETTRVISRDRGVIDRVDDALTNGNPTTDTELYSRAEDRLREAAAQSDLQERAERNTTELLTGLLTDAGFEKVTVVFDAEPADPAGSL